MNQQMKKTYPLSWVVMQNSIQECFKSMSVDEKRILILASPIARTTNATEQDAIVITAENFAQECNISATYLSQIENNVKDPNLKTLNVIAEKLEIPIQILFFLELQ